MKEENVVNFGYVPSELDGTELILGESSFMSLPLPKEYSYINYMTPVLDQGTSSTCVPHAISAVYDYYYSMNGFYDNNTGKFQSKRIAIQQIYNAKTNQGEGMSYKEALEFCKNKGVLTDNEYKKKIPGAHPTKIMNYGKILKLEIIKKSLLINGPVLIATYVRSMNNDFWNGTKFYGGHATCLIGYSDMKNAFLLRNSWGTDFGMNGYVWFPYKDFDEILEAWSVIA